MLHVSFMLLLVKVMWTLHLCWVLWFFILTVPYVGNLCSVNIDAMEDLDEMEVHLRSIDCKRNFCLRLSVAYCVLVQLCSCAPNFYYLGIASLFGCLYTCL